MTDTQPLAQRILLGARLREARKAAKLSSAEASDALGFYPGKMTKSEAGDLRITKDDLDRMIELYGVDTESASVMHRLLTDARRKVPPSKVPAWALKYVGALAAAAEVWIFCPDVFPGTVQTEEYAAAMLKKSVIIRSADVASLAADRARRADRFTGEDPAVLWLVVGEEALYRTVGDAGVLRRQLEFVLSLAQRPNVTIQVMPQDGGAHSSHSSLYSIVSMVPGRPDLVYLEGLSDSEYLGRQHLPVYTNAFDDLRGSALSKERTIELINRRIEDLSGGRTDA